MTKELLKSVAESLKKITPNQSLYPKVSTTPTAAAFALSNLFSLDMEPETSMMMTMFLAPVAAPTYQGLYLGS